MRALLSLCSLNSFPAFLYPGRMIVKIQTELVSQGSWLYSEIISFGFDIDVKMGQVIA